MSATAASAITWEQYNETGRRLFAEGDLAGAEDAFVAAIAEAERSGADPLQLASSLGNLAQLKYQQKDHLRAEELFRRSLELREQSLGSEHPSVLTSINNLAALYVSRGALDEAEPLLKRAMSASARRVDSAQTDLGVNLNNLARLYFKRGDYRQAEPLLIQLLTLKRPHGPEHPEVATVLVSLAKVRHSLGKPDMAERLWRRVLIVRERQLPASDPAVLQAMDGLADSLAAQGKHAAALELRERALKAREEAMGGDHATVVAQRAKVEESRAAAAALVATTTVPVRPRRSSTEVRSATPAPLGNGARTPGASRLMTPPPPAAPPEPVRELEITEAWADDDRIPEPKPVRVSQPVPRVTEPRTNEPKAAEPKTPDANVVEPRPPQPVAAAPRAPQPTPAEPRAPQPTTAEPHAQQAATVEPRERQPVTPTPRASRPIAAESLISQSIAPEPRVSQPMAAVRPGVTQVFERPDRPATPVPPRAPTPAATPSVAAAAPATHAVEWLDHPMGEHDASPDAPARARTRKPGLRFHKYTDGSKTKTLAIAAVVIVAVVIGGVLLGPKLAGGAHTKPAAAATPATPASTVTEAPSTPAPTPTPVATSAPTPAPAAAPPAPVPTSGRTTNPDGFAAHMGAPAAPPAAPDATEPDSTTVTSAEVAHHAPKPAAHAATTKPRPAPADDPTALPAAPSINLDQATKAIDETTKKKIKADSAKAPSF